MNLWSRMTRRGADIVPSVDESTEARSTSIASPAVLDLFGVLPNAAGVSVSEHSALGLSAVYRAVGLVSGSIASLPLRTLHEQDGARIRTRSFLDNPAGSDRQTRFEWTETVMMHLLLHGNAYLAHIFNGAGALVALEPIHPLAVEVRADSNAIGGKLFVVRTSDGKETVFDAATMLHIPGPSTDGLKGISPIRMAATSLGTSIAGELAAATMFKNGAMISGLVTPEDDLSEDDAKAISRTIKAKASGAGNAGDILVLNRKLKFTPWQLSAEDAQFLQSRQFQVEEVARWYGVPPHLLAQTDKQTSWGAGVSEQNRGLARYTLEPWTTRIEQRLSRLLRGSRWAEFDYSAFVQPDPTTEIALLINQVNNGLLTLNEARAIRNMPPVEGGDAVRIPMNINDDASAEEGGEGGGQE